MSDPHVITALVKKRAELAGDIESTHKRLGEMIKALEKLDSTILMFDPEYKVGSSPKPSGPCRTGPSVEKCPELFSQFYAKPQSLLPPARSRAGYV